MILALDTETTGLDPWHGCLPFVVSAMDDLGRTTLWRFQVDGPSREVSAPNSERLEIGELLAEADLVVCHNAKFDIRMLEMLGVPIPKDIWGKLHDTILMSHCLWSAGPHGLKELALNHLDMLDTDEKDLRTACITARRVGEKLGWRIAKPQDPHWPTIKGGEGREWWKADMWMPGELFSRKDSLEGLTDHDLDKIEPAWENICETYAIGDVERTLGLYIRFTELLQEQDQMGRYEVRRRLLEVTYSMEQTGLTLRKSLVEPVRKKHATLAVEHERMCLAVVDGCIDNLNSPKQLQNAMFTVLQLPIVKRTKTGQPSTDKDVIKELVETLPEHSAGGLFIRQLSAWRKRDHAAGTVESYGIGCLDYSLAQAGSFAAAVNFARLHPNLNITGTDTTRLSSNQPNGQNIAKGEGLPKEEKFNLRDLFGPLPGRVWFSHDYNNQEMRLFAYSAEERDLIDAFERGESVHLIIAKELYPREFAECERLGIDFKERYKATLYQWVKNGNFSLIYGAGQRKADLTYHVNGAYTLVRKRFKQIDRFMRAMHDQAETYGYITCLGGYRLQVPKEGPHKAVNYFVQGSAGWAIQLAMNRIYDVLRDQSDYRMLLNVHDELLHEAPIDFAPAFPWMVKDIMEQSGDDLGIPLPCEMTLIRTSWDSSEEVPRPRELAV